ncbi:endonuclease V [Streptomyces sp. WAC 06738]|uniref:endonuclease V n=1 Tax=Streptomyces sp. WAC 06738 TaxID=2203210 RepID=UPI000F6C9ADD|nr:endonuclease V [Streptomyces sp. WAC 06738]AZM48118.1 endonuclease V [Streptomyces sp. WAC 06738]
MELAGALRHPRTVEEAMAEQERLRGLVRVGPAHDVAQWRTAAGVDVAYDDESGACAAAVVVMEVASLAVVDSVTAVSRIEFPYVSGLLAFREIPAIAAALRNLGDPPDVFVCDGYGIAHPRRVGLASHLGVLTGIPSFGVAKNPLYFRCDVPGAERGSSTPLLDGTETVGRALRTRAGVKPVYVSAGHLIGVDDACALTLGLARRYRLPETTRAADRLCRQALPAAAPGEQRPLRGAAGS